MWKIRQGEVKGPLEVGSLIRKATTIAQVAYDGASGSGCQMWNHYKMTEF